MPNPWRQFEALLPTSPLLIGTVVTVELLGGGLLRVSGSAAVGDRVFVREGQIEGPAPTLPTVDIDI